MIRKELIDGSLDRLLEEKGIIANIERYAINDGNGVRTTVFLKGCYLRCKWCSNPETQHFYPEMSFFKDKCIGCGNCVRNCPYDAIGEGMKADRNKCLKCYKSEEPLKCTTKCYIGCRALTGQEMSVREIYDIVKRDVSFYVASGGGVTLSGGEPASQPELAYALLRTLTEKWIDTAIETCGFAEKEDYEQLVPYLNTVFMDIKHMDAEKHRAWTGQSNEKILENVKYVDQLAGVYGTRLFFRIPIIPGFNDQESEVEAIAEFVSKNLKHVTGMELLPYHKLGRGKYYSLDRDYPMEETVSPSDEQMKALNAILAKYEIPVYQF